MEELAEGGSVPVAVGVSDRGQLTGDMGQVTADMGQVTGDMGHVTGYMGEVTESTAREDLLPTEKTF